MGFVKFTVSSAATIKPDPSSSRIYIAFARGDVLHVDSHGGLRFICPSIKMLERHG